MVNIIKNDIYIQIHYFFLIFIMFERRSRPLKVLVRKWYSLSKSYIKLIKCWLKGVPKVSILATRMLAWSSNISASIYARD